MLTDERTVRDVHPSARCFGPAKSHWPGTPDRIVYIVTLAPHLSAVYASGQTPEEAWSLAANRVRSERQLEDVKP